MKQRLILAALCMALCGTACEAVPEEELYWEEEPAPTYLTPEEIAAQFEDFTLPAPSVESVLPEEIPAVPQIPEIPALSADPEVSGIAEPPAPESAPPAEATAGAMQVFQSPLAGKVFLSRDAEREERYYLFTDDAAGLCAVQQTGERSPFWYTYAEDTLELHFAAEPERITLSWTDEQTVLFLWENGRMETLTALPYDPAAFSFYSTQELCARALAHWQKKTGSTPQYADAMPDGEGLIAIQLYDMVDGHTATSTWYYIDRYTAAGYDLLYEPVDLSTVTP